MPPFAARQRSGYTVYVPASPLRGLRISMDDWEFSTRITALRNIYAQLVPELSDLILVGAEQATVMLTPGRQRFQRMLGVAGSIGVITGIGIGVLSYGLQESLRASIGAGAVSGLLTIYASARLQRHAGTGR